MVVAILAVLMIAAGALYVAGFRIALDGSGMFPRFVSSAPDYDALEADRARQREAAPPTSTADDRAPAQSAPASEAAPVAPAGETIGAAEPARPRVTPAVWPDFRGPARDGRSAEVIRTDWPAGGLPLLWKQPIGLGYASFVVAGGRAFTIEQRRREEVVAAYDVETGRELWTNGWEGEFVESMGGDGPRATPTYHDGRVYALGALGELRCLDARDRQASSGAATSSTTTAPSNLEWGMSGAPLIVDDKVIVLPGGSGGQSVVAYDRATGEPMLARARRSGRRTCRRCS